MQITSLRKVSGSVVLAIPPGPPALLRLRVGATACLYIEDGRLIVAPRQKKRYTMSELLSASDYSSPQPPEERLWVNAPPAGGELL